MNTREQKRKAKEKFFKALEYTNNRLSEITDDEIMQMESQIKYYDPFVANLNNDDIAIKHHEIQSILKARLNELMSNPAPKVYQPVSSEIKCDCGHYSDHPMTTSTGTACSRCYDRMS